MKEKIVLSIAYTISASKLFSRTVCSLSPQIHMCDVGQNTSNKKKPAINRLSKIQNRLNSKLCERVYFLDISK